TAEAIVDITTTGATLAANGLKTLEDGAILRSQAQLAASLTADWTDGARAAARMLLGRLAARERAKASHVVRVRLATGAALEGFAAAGVTILSHPAEGAGEYTLLCPRERLMEAAEILRAEAGYVATVNDVDYVFDGGDPLSLKLDSALAIAAKPAPP
ncbi:MAG TPA: hypothetical protein VHC42_09780, partial [Rhizomicrobium sp.]|nr:hypothetical protein [Rhizomicrobium sp.]